MRSGEEDGVIGRFGVAGGVLAGFLLGAALIAGYVLNEHDALAIGRGTGAVMSSPQAMAADARGVDAVTSRAGARTNEDRVAALPAMKGPSGLPLPRFVSLKSGKVNVRRGPSREYGVAWVYHARGLPVEVVAEFGDWRRIRDAEGAEGWVLRTLLSGWRTAMVAPWNGGGLHDLMEAPGGRVVARVKSGVIGRLLTCDGTWCRMRVGDYEGWIRQDALWGVYPGERFAGK